MKIKIYLENKRQQVEDALHKYILLPSDPFKEHIEAMRYSLFAGGKRLRPILCLAAAATIDNTSKVEASLMPTACALECIHTYSLIHDDLPAMDDDDLRRGKPTNHTLFGEAGAILAGDSLLTWAFDLLSQTEITSLPPERQISIIKTISRGAGPLGMVGGQALDIANENKAFPFDTLQTIHRNKTGALILCSIQAGALGAGATADKVDKLTIYGKKIGLSFQIVDDLLNATATTEQLGKAAGSDKDRGKATYPAFFGVEESRRLAKQAVKSAKDALEDFDHRADPLRALADYICTRSN
ncbi:MAG: polyprenyl synthetase family protein [Deltaproteobacteria bacterium]|nr:polyprenyl synthetase family protein [Deltaproteobacteria bacterium]MBW2659192.1 polyprenyl synthetase family protein [Deltaproteobacteria bacterium]